MTTTWKPALKYRSISATTTRRATQGLLMGVGLGLRQAARFSGRARAQINTDEVFEVRTADGVAHHYRFDGARHSVRSVRGASPGSTSFSITFDTAALAFGTMLRPNTIAHVVRLLREGRITYTGNAVNVLWFWGLTRMVVPYDRERPLKDGLPGALTAPNLHSTVYARITHEPVAEELDRSLDDVARARATMAMLRQGNGGTVPWW